MTACRQAIIENGQIVGWRDYTPPKKTPAVRAGEFWAWNDQTQYPDETGSLEVVASYIATVDPECIPLYQGGKPLNTAEKSRFRAFIASK